MFDTTYDNLSPKAIMLSPYGTTIAASGYYIYNASSVFNNTGDDVRLIDASGQEIDKYAYGNSAADKSWYRLAPGGAWQSYQDSTPAKGTVNN